MSLANPRLRDRWTDDPVDPGRMELDNPDVQQLIAAISPESQATDLGGVMSLNARLDAVELVLRVHQPSVTRQRLLAQQNIRRALASQGLLVPTPGIWQNATVFRCGGHWAELDGYIPHERLPHTPDSYSWLFQAMGTLHTGLSQLDLAVPRPTIAAYAPPRSLRRWLPITEAAVQSDPEAADVARLLRSLVNQLRNQWVPETELPRQLVHGDVRLSNICRTLEGNTVYFDFGFLARRPRIHELAYSLAFMLLAFGGHQVLDTFDWESSLRLVEEYETAANVRLTPTERRALAPCTASVPLYAAALDGFTEKPITNLRSRRSFLQLSEWLLAHPAAMRNILSGRE